MLALFAILPRYRTRENGEPQGSISCGRIRKKGAPFRSQTKARSERKKTQRRSSEEQIITGSGRRMEKKNHGVNPLMDSHLQTKSTGAFYGRPRNGKKIKAENHDELSPFFFCVLSKRHSRISNRSAPAIAGPRFALFPFPSDQTTSSPAAARRDLYASSFAVLCASIGRRPPFWHHEKEESDNKAEIRTS